MSKMASKVLFFKIALILKSIQPYAAEILYSSSLYLFSLHNITASCTKFYKLKPLNIHQYNVITVSHFLNPGHICIWLEAITLA